MTNLLEKTDPDRPLHGVCLAEYLCDDGGRRTCGVCASDVSGRWECDDCRRVRWLLAVLSPS